jgi:hypothetical protein
MEHVHATGVDYEGAACASVPVSQSLDVLQASVQLAKVYKEHYKAAKEQLASQPKSKQFDFDEQVRITECVRADSHTGGCRCNAPCKCISGGTTISCSRTL